MKYEKSQRVRFPTTLSVLLCSLIQIGPRMSRIAHAVRPLMKTEVALKNLEMTVPRELGPVTGGNLSGLTLEEPTVQARVIKQTQQYVAYRRGTLSEKKWQHLCSAESLKQTENFFCAYEEDRQDRVATRAVSRSRAERREIANLLKAANFSRLSDRTYADVVGAVGSLGSLAAVAEVASHALEQKTCIAPEITTALGYKLEEGFPDQNMIETTKKLYKQAIGCGKDFASANASFRFGLIQISEHRCDEIKQLMLTVEGTPSASTYHARAKYWRYFCAGAMGDTVSKLSAKESLLHDHPLSFQNLAVSGDDPDVLGQVMRAESPMLAFRSLIHPEANSLLRSVESLLVAKQNGPASEIVDRNLATIAGLEPEVRLYAAVLLDRTGSTLPKFKVLAALFDEAPRMISAATMKLYFPLGYFSIVKAKEAEIDPLLLLSLIRQESAFNKEARSIVGARGLMQVMPGTARMIASVRARSLYDPKININVGTSYLLKRLHQYSGDVELTLAAYNAGFARVDSWKKRYPTDNKMLFLDSIPFRETRDYVSMILRNYFWYVKLYGMDQTETAAVPEKESEINSDKLAQNISRTPAAASTAENAKREAVATKTLAIMSANAGQAAGVLATRPYTD